MLSSGKPCTFISRHIIILTEKVHPAFSEFIKAVSVKIKSNFIKMRSFIFFVFLITCGIGDVKQLLYTLLTVNIISKVIILSPLRVEA